MAIAASIDRHINDGILSAGDKLPSLRALAQHHNCAKNTVVAAYELLVSKGVIEPRRGSGYFVLDSTRPPQQEEENSSLNRALDLIWLVREQLKPLEPGVTSVGDGFPPQSWLSEARLDRYHQRVVRTGIGSLFRHGGRFGYAPLRRTLVRKMAELSIETEPQHIILTHGGNAALEIVIRYFIAPNSAVLVDDPGYYMLNGKLKLVGAQIIGVPRLRDGPDTHAIEALIKRHKPKIYFIQPLSQNPTGTDITLAKAYKILQLAEKYNIIIIENDPLAEFKPPTAPRLSALDQFNKTIYIGSFSKSLPAALRVGFIVCHKDLASDLADIKALTHISSSEYSERTVDVILNERRYLKHIQRLRESLNTATVQAYRFFDSIHADVFTRNPQSLYIWASLPGIDDSAIFAERMIAQKIVMAPGRIFCVDANSKNKFFRFNAGLVNNQKFISIIKNALNIN